MTDPIWQGKLIRLVIPDLEQDAARIAAWERDSEYHRFSDSRPSIPISSQAQREFLEEGIQEGVVLMIRTLEEDRVIGSLDLNGISWPSGDAWVGIGIGEKDCWDKGYGTEAMGLIIRYGFLELNLRRISLTVFDYNQRAIRSYQKLGFKEEGRARDAVRRNGRYWEMLYMGLLREEWEQVQAGKP